MMLPATSEVAMVVVVVAPLEEEALEVAVVVVEFLVVVDVVAVKLVEDLKEGDEEVEVETRRGEADVILNEVVLVPLHWGEAAVFWAAREEREEAAVSRSEEGRILEDEVVEKEEDAVDAVEVDVKNCRFATERDLNHVTATATTATRMLVRIIGRSENDGEKPAPSRRKRTESACVTRSRLVARARFCQEPHCMTRRLPKMMTNTASITTVHVADLLAKSNRKNRHLGIILFDHPTHHMHRRNIEMVGLLLAAVGWMLDSEVIKTRHLLNTVGLMLQE
jgi:hypothetical protein